MTTKEMMELLLQGKKLTSNLWGERQYICLDKEGNLIDEKRKLISHSDCLYILTYNDKLGEYIECVDFFTALDHMLNGGKARRLVDGDTELQCDDIGRIVNIVNGKSFPITFHREDYKTKDWILL